jgi:hypothetical protein
MLVVVYEIIIQLVILIFLHMLDFMTYITSCLTFYKVLISECSIIQDGQQFWPIWKILHKISELEWTISIRVSVNIRR